MGRGQQTPQAGESFPDLGLGEGALPGQILDCQPHHGTVENQNIGGGGPIAQVRQAVLQLVTQVLNHPLHGGADGGILVGSTHQPKQHAHPGQKGHGGGQTGQEGFDGGGGRAGLRRPRQDLVHRILGNGEEEVVAGGKVIGEMTLTHPGGLGHPGLGQGAEPLVPQELIPGGQNALANGEGAGVGARSVMFHGLVTLPKSW